METKTVLIYYTCLTHDDAIEQLCRTQLLKANLPIISVSRNEPIDFGDNIVTEGVRGPITMHQQILDGLRYAKTKYPNVENIFLCESDVLYHPSHFDFKAPSADIFYYNTNVWKFIWPKGPFTWTDNLQQVSGMTAHIDAALRFYERRNIEIYEDGFDGHYEAGPKTGAIAENYLSAVPNICIRHSENLTKTKTSPDDFRNPAYAKGWKEADHVEGWNIPVP